MGTENIHPTLDIYYVQDTISLSRILQSFEESKNIPK